MRRAGNRRHWFTASSLRRQLIVLISLVWVPFLMFSLMRVAAQYQYDVYSIDRADRAFARAVAETFEGYLDDVWDVELALGLAISQGSFSLKQMEQLMGQYLKTVGDRAVLCSLSWVNSKGRILASTFSKARGHTVASEPYFQKILSGEDQVVSDFGLGGLSDGWAIVTGRAIRYNGKLVGVVLGALDPRKMYRWFQWDRDSRDWVLIDTNGTIVYQHPVREATLYPRYVNTSSWAGTVLRKRQITLVSVQNVFGASNHMATATPIPDIGWIVLVSDLEGYGTLFPRANTVRDLLFLLLTAVVSLVFADGWGSVIVRRVRKLQQAAVSVSKGKMNLSLELEGSDELAATAQAFNHMICRIRKLEAERERFLQIAAHELRNPMAAIKGVVQMVRLKLEKGLPVDDILSTIEPLEREVTRLSSLLDDVVNAFRAHSNQLEIKLETIDLDAVVQAALQPLMLSPGGSRYVYTKQTSTPAWVKGDTARLEEVLRNLVGNATKYSPPGSPIEVSLKVADGYAVVAVRDRGPGIPSEQLENIFDAFYRTPDSAQSPVRGLGLGLYICRNIVRRHGGQLEVQSSPGKGSTFSFWVPLASELSIRGKKK